MIFLFLLRYTHVIIIVLQVFVLLDVYIVFVCKNNGIVLKMMWLLWWYWWYFYNIRFRKIDFNGFAFLESFRFFTLINLTIEELFKIKQHKVSLLVAYQCDQTKKYKYSKN